jgi:hypothetical protein
LSRTWLVMSVSAATAPMTVQGLSGLEGFDRLDHVDRKKISDRPPDDVFILQRENALGPFCPDQDPCLLIDDGYGGVHGLDHRFKISFQNFMGLKNSLQHRLLIEVTGRLARFIFNEKVGVVCE